MMQPLPPEVSDALRQASEWRLLSALFSRPTADWRREITAAREECSNANLRQASAAALEEAAEGVYHSIFGPGGPAAPREASYRTTLQLGYLLAELEAYYCAFAYEPDSHEPIDHVATEIDFIAFLRLKEALARAHDQLDEADIVRSAAETFLADHLSAIAEPLCNSLQHSGFAYLQQASQLLLERVGRPSAAAGPALDGELVQIEDASFVCGPSPADRSGF
jgi:TorA maturation chaperone TorD